jgi:hypothetical protein
MLDADAPSTELLHAITAEDAGAVRSVLARYPDLRARLDAPLPGLPFGATPLLGAVARGSLEVIDVLLDAGADINVRSRWWAGGFGALDSADPSIVPFLVARGAAVDVNAAATARRRCTSPPRSTSRAYCSRREPTSTHATWITSPRPRSIC